MRAAVEDKENAQSSLTQIKHELQRRVEEAIEEKENRDKDYVVLDRKYQTLKSNQTKEKQDLKEEISRLKQEKEKYKQKVRKANYGLQSMQKKFEVLEQQV